MASSNPLYELFGGYYPGDPIPRGGKKSKPAKPAEFNPTRAVDGYVAAMKKDLDFLNISSLTKEVFIGDIDKALKVTIKSPKGDKSWDAMRAVELGDEEEIQGVQVSLSINPKKWAEDPKKMAKKTLQQVAKDFTSWSDANTHFEQANLWQPLINPNESKELGPLAKWAFSGYPGEDLNHKEGTEDKGPFQLKGLGVEAKELQDYKINKGAEFESMREQEKLGLYHEAKVRAIQNGAIPSTGNYSQWKKQEKGEALKDVDLYGGAAAAFKDLTHNARSSSSREGKYRTYLNNTGIAVADELRRVKQVGGITDEHHLLAADNLILRAEIFRAISGATGKGDSKTYCYGESAHRSKANDLTWSGVGTGTGGVIKKLASFNAQKNNDRKKPDAVNALHDFFGKSGEGAKKGTLQNLEEVLSYKDTFFKDKIAAYSKKLERVRRVGTIEEIREVESLLNKTRKMQASLEKDLTPAKALVSKLKNVGSQYDLENLTNSQIKSLEIKLKDIEKGFSGTPYIPGGVGFRGGIHSLGENLINKGLSDSEFIEFVNSNENIVGAKRAINTTPVASSVRTRESNIDWADKIIEDGPLSLIQDYAKVKIRNKVSKYAPAEIIKKELKKRHYFGLDYDPDYGLEFGLDGKTQLSGSKYTGNLAAKRIAKKKAFQNIQKLSVTLPDGRVVTIDIVGNKDFDLAVKLFGRTNLQDTIKELHLDGVDVVNLLNGKVGLLNKFGHRIGFNVDDKDLDKTIKNAERIKGWLKKHGNTFGIRFDENGDLLTDEENVGLVMSVLKKIHDTEKNDSSRISLLQSGVGRLNKLSSKLNLYREKLYRSKVIGGFLKIIGKYSDRREIIEQATRKIAKALAKLITKGLEKLLAIGTGGISEALAPIVSAIGKVLEKAIELTLRFVIKTIGKTIEAIKKGDISIVGDFVEKTAGHMLRFLGLIIIVINFLFLRPTAKQIESMTSTITPIDHTHGTIFVDEGGSPGFSSLCPPDFCETVASVSCFDLVGNWPENALQVIQNAADHLAANHGHYVDKLCSAANGRIEVAWNGSQTACGQYPGGNQIYFGDSRCWTYNPNDEKSLNTFIYLFAHETGHMFDRKYPTYRISLAEAMTKDCGALPTYIGGSDTNCSTSTGISEAFAEMIGNFVAPHTHCNSKLGSNNQIPTKVVVVNGEEQVVVDVVQFWKGPWVCPRGYTNHLNLAREIFETPHTVAGTDQQNRVQTN